MSLITNDQALGNLVPDSMPGSRTVLTPREVSLLHLTIPSEVIQILPADFVKRARVLPLELRNGSVRIATAEPGNQQIIEDIRLLTGLEVEESPADAAELVEKIAECYQVTVEQIIQNL